MLLGQDDNFDFNYNDHDYSEGVIDNEMNAADEMRKCKGIQIFMMMKNDVNDHQESVID